MIQKKHLAFHSTLERLSYLLDGRLRLPQLLGEVREALQGAAKLAEVRLRLLQLLHQLPGEVAVEVLLRGKVLPVGKSKEGLSSAYV